MSPRQEFRRDLGSYAIGYALALALTGIAFATVYFHWLGPAHAFALVLALAAVQVLVHLRCFLHISFERTAREDLQLVLFSALVILVMVGGTLIILFDEYKRMMM